MDKSAAITNNAQPGILLQKKVVSSAGCLRFLFIQLPASTLTMTDKEIILEGTFLKQVITYDQIEKVDIKPFLDWGFNIYRSYLYGVGVKIWRKGAVPNLATLVRDRDLRGLNPNNSMVVIINPVLIFNILRQKRPDLFSSNPQI